MDIVILAIYGTTAGILAGIFGIGGGTIIVPAMMLFGFDIKNAIGISAMQMIFSSVYGTYLNIKAKILNFKIAKFVAFGGLCGATFSGFIVHSLQPIYLEIAFILICIYSLFKNIKQKSEIKSTKNNIPKEFILFIVGFVTGIFAISLGIGGGLIIVPVVAYYLNIPTKQVVPISLFFVIFSSLSGTISLAINGYANYKEGFIVGIFSLFGVYIGTQINKKMSNRFHKNAVTILYLIVLAVMIKNIIS
ncbi:MAG: sulfite exporter TauE/SafE family protein [Helicobacteraceae bacterium]|nr:sulfite exporter TauE/SafE family protein [Helicobacteraceae bacterium]